MGKPFSPVENRTSKSFEVSCMFRREPSTWVASVRKLYFFLLTLDLSSESFTRGIRYLGDKIERAREDKFFTWSFEERSLYLNLRRLTLKLSKKKDYQLEPLIKYA